MSLIPYTKSATAIIRATRKAPKKGEIRAMPETTTASTPTPILIAFAQPGSLLFHIPIKILEMPLNNKARAASVITTRAANIGNANAAPARAITSIPIPIWAARWFL
jgi:hypothetical protein